MVCSLVTCFGGTGLGVMTDGRLDKSIMGFMGMDQTPSTSSASLVYQSSPQAKHLLLKMLTQGVSQPVSEKVFLS